MIEQLFKQLIDVIINDKTTPEDIKLIKYVFYSGFDACFFTINNIENVDEGMETIEQLREELIDYKNSMNNPTINEQVH